MVSQAIFQPLLNLLVRLKIMDFSEVTCPTCFETFSVSVPPPAELPCEVDYDCEVCCRPLILSFSEESGLPYADARGIHD